MTRKINVQRNIWMNLEDRKGGAVEEPYRFFVKPLIIESTGKCGWIPANEEFVLLIPGRYICFACAFMPIFILVLFFHDPRWQDTCVPLIVITKLMAPMQKIILNATATTASAFTAGKPTIPLNGRQPMIEKNWAIGSVGAKSSNAVFALSVDWSLCWIWLLIDRQLWHQIPLNGKILVSRCS